MEMTRKRWFTIFVDSPSVLVAGLGWSRRQTEVMGNIFGFISLVAIAVLIEAAVMKGGAG
jgi:hypothetical protein